MAAAGATSDFDVPLLDYETIVSAVFDLSDGNVNVTVDDFKKIQSEMAIKIYKTLLFAHFQASSELLSQSESVRHRSVAHHTPIPVWLPWKAPYRDFGVELKNPCLFEDGLSLVGLVNTLSYVMKMCAIKSFRMKDLVAPKPKRTHKMLSAFVNYIRFCASKQSVVDYTFSLISERKQRNAELQQRKLERYKRIEELEIRRSEEQVELEKLAPEAVTWRTRYNEYIENQKEMERRSTAKENALADEADLKDILNIEDKIKENTAAQIERSSLLNRLSLKSRQLNDLSEDAQYALKLISTFVSISTRKKDSMRSFEEIKDRGRIQEQNFKDIAAKIQNVKRQHNTKSEKLSRMQLQHQKRFTADMDVLELEKKKRSALKSEINMMVQEGLKEVEAETQDVSELLDLEKLEFKKNMQNAKNLYGCILDQMDIYHDKLTKGWGLIMPFMK